MLQQVGVARTEIRELIHSSGIPADPKGWVKKARTAVRNARSACPVEAIKSLSRKDQDEVESCIEEASTLDALADRVESDMVSHDGE